MDYFQGMDWTPWLPIRRDDSADPTPLISLYLQLLSPDVCDGHASDDSCSAELAPAERIRKTREPGQAP